MLHAKRKETLGIFICSNNANPSMFVDDDELEKA